MLALRIEAVLVVFLCAGAGLGVGPVSGQLPEGSSEVNKVSGGGGNEPVKNPLPAQFIDHTRSQDPSQPGADTAAPVHKDRVVRMLIGEREGRDTSGQLASEEKDVFGGGGTEAVKNVLPDEMEKTGNETTTPDEATGHDWIFSNSIEGGKRSISSPLQSSTRMFSSERACGFSIETDRGIIYPWVATISCNRIQCTGSLISSSLILTSASCILSCANDAVRVTLGDSRIIKVIEVQAESAVVQPGFSSSRDPQLDIGLVKLLTPIDFNSNPLIYPICLVGVETDDPSIECEVVLSGQRQPIHQNPFQKSVVSCFQPGNTICSSNGILQKSACVRLNNCISISAQSSVPVICRRMNQIPARYYQWAVTGGDHHSPGGGVCFNGVARISDSISFLSSGLTSPSITT